MKKINLLEYTKEISEKLADDNLFITHLNISYKIIIYYENNIGNINKLSLEEFNGFVDRIYERYINDDNNDILDQIIENEFS